MGTHPDYPRNNFYERRRPYYEPRRHIFCKLCSKYLADNELVGDMVQHGIIKIIVPIPDPQKLVRKDPQ
ncbi:MAG: hypothetical protein WA799_00925 [Nitrosotalea sp.]